MPFGIGTVVIAIPIFFTVEFYDVAGGDAMGACIKILIPIRTLTMPIVRMAVILTTRCQRITSRGSASIVNIQRIGGSSVKFGLNGNGDTIVTRSAGKSCLTGTAS